MPHPRKLRYTPSTTTDFLWTMPCRGRRRHRLSLRHGRIHLHDHSWAEIQAALLTATLGGPPPPSCIQTLLAIRHRVTTNSVVLSDHLTLDPSLIPQTFRDAILVARYARSHTHTPLITPLHPSGTLRAQAAVRYFEPLLTACHAAGVDDVIKAVWLPEMTHPTLVTTETPEVPVLLYANGGWSMNQQTEKPFVFFRRWSSPYRKLDTLISQWLMHHQGPNHGELLHTI